MAKIKIPADIAKAIKAGKVVIWTQKNATGSAIIYINGAKAKISDVNQIIYNADKAPLFLEKGMIMRNWVVAPKTVYLSGGTIIDWSVPAKDIFIDANIFDKDHPLEYRLGKSLNWFSGDFNNPVRAESFININKGCREICRFREI